MTTPPPYPLHPQPMQRSWLERDALWKIPLGCLVLLLLAGVFVTVLIAVITASFHNSVAYQQALAKASENQQVRDLIGEPIKAGWFSSGQISVNGGTGKADLSIPISGPRGKGTIRAIARKNGVWNFTWLQVTIEGRSQSINLLPDQSSPPDDTQPDSHTF